MLLLWVSEYIKVKYKTSNPSRCLVDKSFSLLKLWMKTLTVGRQMVTLKQTVKHLHVWTLTARPHRKLRQIDPTNYFTFFHFRGHFWTVTWNRDGKGNQDNYEYVMCVLNPNQNGAEAVSPAGILCFVQVSVRKSILPVQYGAYQLSSVLSKRIHTHTNKYR